MKKTLLKNEEDFYSFKSRNTGNIQGHGIVKSWISEPEKYPCVVVWEIEHYDNGPDMLDGEFVYLNDFEL